MKQITFFITLFIIAQSAFSQETITVKSSVKKISIGTSSAEEKKNTGKTDREDENKKTQPVTEKTNFDYSKSCTLPQTIIIEKTNISETYIKQQIPTLRTVFDNAVIKAIEKQVNECNNETDNQIARLKAQATTYSLEKQELLKLKDIKKIQEQITEKEKSKGNIIEQIKSDLASVSLKGLYICVFKDLNPYGGPSQSEIQDLSKSAIVPEAIQFLNGVFISSCTDLYKDGKTEIFNNHIKTIISGEMGVEKVLFTKRTKGQTQFIYIAKVNVTPLKKAVKPNNMVYGENTNKPLVLDPVNNAEYKVKLQEFGVSENDINEMLSQINSLQETINSENILARKQQQNIISSGNANIDKIDKDISDLKAQLKNSSSLVKKLIEEKTNVKYKENNTEESITEALVYFDNKIQTTYSDMISIKEQEMLGKYNTNVSSEGNPAEDIAKAAMLLVDQIKKNYTKVEHFFKVQELQNNEFIKNQIAQEKELYREIDKIWIYPVPGDNNNYTLTLIAKFKVKK